MEVPLGISSGTWDFHRIPLGILSGWKSQRDVKLFSDPAGNSQRVEVPLGILSGMWNCYQIPLEILSGWKSVPLGIPSGT